MGEIGIFRQQPRMRARRRCCLFVPCQQAQAILGAFMIELFQNTVFRWRHCLRGGIKGGRRGQQEDTSAIPGKLHRHPQ